MEKNLSFKCIIIQNPCSNKRLPLKGLFGVGFIFVILNAHQMQSHRGIYLIFISITFRSSATSTSNWLTIDSMSWLVLISQFMTNAKMLISRVVRFGENKFYCCHSDDVKFCKISIDSTSASVRHGLGVNIWIFVFIVISYFHVCTTV